MTRFVQMHCLTFYPPSNANRDDTGRPKTCIIGGKERLRLSSQAIKRAIRTGAVFEAAFGEIGVHMGERTKRFGAEIVAEIEAAKEIDDELRTKLKFLTALFGKLDEKADKEDNVIRNNTLVFVSPKERKRFRHLAFVMSGLENGDIETVNKLDALVVEASKKKKNQKNLNAACDAVRQELFVRGETAVDIALFGRMLAADPAYNVDAAVQVGHAFTVDAVTVEDDYFTAVDDLNKGDEDKGAAHIGETGFGSGVFYLYSCIDRALLARNLGGDEGLAGRAIEAYARALATASPSGKRAGFAHNPEAEVMLVERGQDQPRTLAGAFQKAIRADDVAEAAAGALIERRDKLDEAYGRQIEARLFDPLERITGGPERAATLDAIADFAGRG